MWEKGKSGNPAGPAKRRLITSNIERELLQAFEDKNITKGRRIAEQVVELALGGDKWAIQFITERTEGKPEQTVNVRQAVEELTDDELAAIAAGSGEGTLIEKGGEEKPTQVH